MGGAAAMSDEPVLFNVDAESGVGTITINRPRSMNALNLPVFARLRDIAAAARWDRSLRVLILTGSGERAFSAGNDVKPGGAFSSEGGDDSRRLQVEAIEHLCAVPQPLLGAVNGVCFTGALELLLACDIIVAARNAAAFCDTHARLGLVPTWGLSARLPRRIGLAQAKLLSFTSRRIGSEEALRMGLVDVVAADSELAATVGALAAQIAANSSDSIAKQKRMMNMGFETTVREALAWTDEVRGFHPGQGRDMKERMAGLFKPKPKL
jgi:enoyl-CoA hydratase